VALLSVVVVGAVATVAARPGLHAVEHLTFPVPVALPAVTLVAGEYTFQVNHVDAGNVVNVRHRQSNRLVFQGFTMAVERPRGLTKSVVFAEAVEGQATPIAAWYPMGESRGYQFVYSR
jgi:hypothetical protein